MIVAVFSLLHAALQRLDYTFSLFQYLINSSVQNATCCCCVRQKGHLCITTLHLIPSLKRIDIIQGSVKREPRKLVDRHYFLPICSSMVKGPVWLGLTVLKWRAQSVTAERQLRKLFLTASQLLAVIFKLRAWCLAVCYFGCSKNLGVSGTDQICSVNMIFER